MSLCIALIAYSSGLLLSLQILLLLADCITLYYTVMPLSTSIEQLILLFAVKTPLKLPLCRMGSPYGFRRTLRIYEDA
jgi:hypothetical protein